MDTRAIDDAIAELRKQKAQLEQVIGMIELFGEGKRRRGRPPKFLAEALRVAKGAARDESAAERKKATARKAEVRKSAKRKQPAPDRL